MHPAVSNMKRLSRKAWACLGAILAVSTVVIAIVMFSQTAPSVPVVNLASNCATLTPSATSVLLGSSGFLTFDCSTNGAAFHVAGASSATPTFSLGAGYTTLWIYRHAIPPTSGCASGGNAVQLSSGSSVNFGQSDDEDYCAQYVNAPATGLGTWTISWST